MISENKGLFTLDTRNTTYAFMVLPTGHPEHLYYGKKIAIAGHGEALSHKQTTPVGNTVSYSDENVSFSLEAARLEMSSYGKGDIREPFLEIVHADGSFTSDFLYDSFEIKSGRDELTTLPCSYGSEAEVSQLKLVLKDKNYGLTLELYYYVYENCDVIGRSCRLINDSDVRVDIRRVMSMLMDIDGAGYVFTTFNGAWAREMERHDTVVTAGKHVNFSYTGTSSSRANPFVMISKKDTTQDQGSCIGLNLIYSGNHYEAVEAGMCDSTRIVAGINPQSFSYILDAGETFEAPEAVMTYSDKGFNAMSRNMHDFVRKHIVRGQWQYKERPVLLNSWEAAYFDISERKLYELAKAGHDVGIELFVMDDGWFGHRNNDDSSLGDWFVNEKKITGGLKNLVDQVNKIGLKFGIWFEPEMISPDSDLYEKHPEWAIQIQNREATQSRNQYVLDLSCREVRDYVYECVASVLRSANIEYVKWDMNRQLSDMGSAYLAEDAQQELFHRYVLGVYELQERLVTDFPDLLLENCSGGGARFDPGMLYYSPQIWCSDDTDAIERLMIQEGTELIYPLSAMGAHVSDCPNHIVGRVTPFKTRGHVALSGTFGYELDITKIAEEERNMIPEQTQMYHKYHDLIREGDYFRIASYRENHLYDCWASAAKDRSEVLVTYVQVLGQANVHSRRIYLDGFDPDKTYRLEGTDEVYTGEMLMKVGFLMRDFRGDFQSRLYHFVAE